MDPKESIDKLIECLKIEKALIVQGVFGCTRYVNEPRIVQKIAGHPIYGWKPSDRREIDFSSKIGHAIVIIGASKGGRKGGYVYFVDPKDGSNPTNPLQQKIYVISYQNLITNITDISGLKIKNGIGAVFGFALFYPQSVSLT